MPDPTPNPATETTPATTAAPAAPAAPLAPEPEDWASKAVEEDPRLALGINRLMEQYRSNPAIVERLEGLFVPPPATPPATPPTVPAAATTNTTPAPDLNAAILSALGGKESLDTLRAAAAHLQEQREKAAMDETYGRLHSQAVAVARQAHGAYFAGSLGEKVARLGVERSLRTGEPLEAATQAEAKEFLAGSEELAKTVIAAKGPEGARLVMAAGLQGGPPPNTDYSKMSNKEQEDAMTAIFREEMLKARMGA